jgi:hypothetical protein
MRKKPKEEPIKKRYKIFEYKPWFFWQKCCECGDEIRREVVYQIFIGWYRKKLATLLGPDIISNEISFDSYYFCSKCCTSSQDAENLFIIKYLPLYMS